jgi:hypothetical protein
MHIRAAVSSRRGCVRIVTHSILAVSPSFVRVSATSPFTTYHTHVSALVGAGNHPNGTGRTVLVKVGTGEYRELWTNDDAMQMSATAILKALKHDDIFANKLNNLPLDECKVWVLPAIAGKLPTAEEEQSATELQGSDVISSIMKSGDKQDLALHVSLPTHFVSGALASVA